MNIASKFYCGVANSILFASTLCSAMFITSMTFERFYSIMQPHKAASFNTLKRAKITILGIVIFSVLYNIPHIPITLQVGAHCIPYGNTRESAAGQFYYWFSTILNFFLPFVLLLVMNSFIIHTLQNRSILSATMSIHRNQGQVQGQNEGRSSNSKIKSSERQIIVTLLSVTFAFLILTTPAYSLFLYAIFYDYEQSPYAFAGYYLFYNVARQTYYTNYGINFFLYVISGRKFRSDLINLFGCAREKPIVSDSSEVETKVFTI